MKVRRGMKIWVNGIVQGVGFRPFVYAQATARGLTGWVRNTSSGVEIEVNGEPQALRSFVEALQSQSPPLARIDSLRVESRPHNGYVSFEIIASQPQPGEFIPISPDVTICVECQKELFDPHDRRYRYPFINCTHCGPRFTIIQDIPYDRPNTTMASFGMCRQCRAEYDDPADRRFHAQPIACPQCGPQVWFEVGGEKLAEGEEALQLARQHLRTGDILAVKGLGGYHLACDAINPEALARLRQRKQRSDKPFALMAFDLDTIVRHCMVSDEEAALLNARQRPVVLLERRPESSISSLVAPNQRTLGFMLPYTPLHLLLLQPESSFPETLVMTSGNLSEEPIAYQDGEARTRLAPLADGFLMHNRPIHMRVDDSVTRRVERQSYPLRRGRGYAPDPIRLPRQTPPLLAVGAELKNTFCLTRQHYAFLSHHIGDLENFETLQSFEQGIAHFERLFRIQPEMIAADLHPDYLATRYAHQRAEQQSLRLVQVQHHHAHLATCLADNGWDDEVEVIGVLYDGAGLGSDGAIWGGEFLLGGYAAYRRMAHLIYTPLPGGDVTVHKPARMALAHLQRAGIEWQDDLPPLQAFSAEQRQTLRAQLDHNINAPPTSSMGRLFDAASALLGIRAAINYEGQAAIELEALADPHEQAAYPFHISGRLIDPKPLWLALLKERRAGVPTATLSARFHNGVARMTAQVCEQIRQQTGNAIVALSGGVWQNMLLLTKTRALLQAGGFQVLIHRQVPANDGGIALGQTMIAAHTGRDSGQSNSV